MSTKTNHLLSINPAIPSNSLTARMDRAFWFMRRGSCVIGHLDRSRIRIGINFNEIGYCLDRYTATPSDRAAQEQTE